MAYVLLDDQIAQHPKVLRAGAEAAWLWACAIAYCNRQLTDGLVPAEALATMGTFRTPPGKLAARLVEVRLFEPVGDDYRVHDYLAHNPSKATVDQRRGDAAARKASYRARKGRREDRPSSGQNWHGDVPQVSHWDIDGTGASSRAHVPTPTPTTQITDTHPAGAGGSPPGRIVPFAPDGRPRHCAYHSPAGLDVPHGLHRVFVRRLTNAGATADAANEVLFTWYRETEAAWAGPDVVGETDYGFWRARWQERYGTTGRAVARRRSGSHAGGGTGTREIHVEPWICRHNPRCGHRTACALTTAKEVRAGRLAVPDVPAVLRAEVLEFLEGADGLTAVQA